MKTKIGFDISGKVIWLKFKLNTYVSQSCSICAVILWPTFFSMLQLKGSVELSSYTKSPLLVECHTNPQSLNAATLHLHITSYWDGINTRRNTTYSWEIRTFYLTKVAAAKSKGYHLPLLFTHISSVIACKLLKMYYLLDVAVFLCEYIISIINDRICSRNIHSSRSCDCLYLGMDFRK